MLLFLLLTIGLAQGIEVNDQVALSLDGGEQVDGWFVRAEAGSVVLHVPELGRSAVIPVSVVKAVQCNQEKWSLERFVSEVAEAQHRYEAWLESPPPHPHPVVLAGPSIVLAGTGHAILGDWEFAKGMMLLDGVAMGTMAIEGFGQQRVQVFYTAALISLIFKAYAVSDAAHRTRQRRRRLGIENKRFEKSGS
ncbi:MAG: hypothetical protein ACPGTU_13030 [Myxococcota bacterium]